ncbi:MAG: hypothetical protein V7K97_02850 [Nostoc sp.]|uniref:hypothetical protein n=1 Tax=Nostoc sp. TaxID=1180 RepID=UPI002FF71DEA
MPESILSSLTLPPRSLPIWASGDRSSFLSTRRSSRSLEKWAGYIPWNYARFLNYCTDRLFLQRVGGRYRFLHKLLQEHFAQMEFKRNVD